MTKKCAFIPENRGHDYARGDGVDKHDPENEFDAGHDSDLRHHRKNDRGELKREWEIAPIYIYGKISDGSVQWLDTHSSLTKLEF